MTTRLFRRTFGWLWFALLLLVLPAKKLPVLPQLRIELINGSEDAAVGIHGRAFVYALCHESCQHEGEAYRVLREFSFRVDRPELLVNIESSTLALLLKQFNKLGFGVQELHLNYAAHSVVHFVS